MRSSRIHTEYVPREMKRGRRVVELDRAIAEAAWVRPVLKRYQELAAYYPRDAAFGEILPGLVERGRLTARQARDTIAALEAARQVTGL